MTKYDTRLSAVVAELQDPAIANAIASRPCLNCFHGPHGKKCSGMLRSGQCYCDEWIPRLHGTSPVRLERFRVRELRRAR